MAPSGALDRSRCQVGGSGTVVAQEYQRGYKLHDRVLRPSMVLVGEPETAEVRS